MRLRRFRDRTEQRVQPRVVGKYQRIIEDERERARALRQQPRIGEPGKHRDLLARTSAHLPRCLVLAPAHEAIDDKRVDPSSREGVRVKELLLRVEARLDETVDPDSIGSVAAVAEALVRLLARSVARERRSSAG